MMNGERIALQSLIDEERRRREYRLRCLEDECAAAEAKTKAERAQRERRRLAAEAQARERRRQAPEQQPGRRVIGGPWRTMRGGRPCEETRLEIDGRPITEHRFLDFG